jgi:predicted RNase H-like HicB family nuclease
VSEYIVIFQEAEDGGWGAYLPDLPGVVALGDSLAEAEERIQEALQAYADEMRSLGRDLPEPAHAVGTVQA